MSYNVVAACATGLLSVIKGVELLKRNIVDLVIAGSIETSKIPLIEAAFSKMGVLSSQGQTRPFSMDRDGFIIGEGGAVVVMTRSADCSENNTPTITGYAYGNDATDIVSINSNAKSIQHIIRQSVNMAGLDSVDYINAHGTGTALNDELELKGISTAFTDTSNIYVNSTKYYTGHLLGATGSVELVLGLLSMNHQQYISNVYLTEPMAGMSQFSKYNQSGISTMLSLNYGFGGHIAALVVDQTLRKHTSAI